MDSAGVVAVSTWLAEREAIPFLKMTFQGYRSPTVGLVSTIGLGLNFSSFIGDLAKLALEQCNGEADRPGLVWPAELFILSPVGPVATASTKATLLITWRLLDVVALEVGFDRKVVSHCCWKPTWDSKHCSGSPWE